MRDLIRNYKQIIKGKNGPDSDSELLLSSSTSAENSTSTEAAEPRIFQQENCSSDSENDNPEKGSTEKFGQQKQNNFIKRKFLSKNSFKMNKNDYLYDILDHSTLNEVVTENTKLISSKKIIIDDNQPSFSRSQSINDHTNSSLVTIFAVWNTTVGSSLLAMAWGMGKAGLFPGIVINLLVVALCLYTAYVLLKINEKHGIAGQNFEVPELCRLLIGRWAEIVSKIFSLIVLIGGDIVYWILMSNFLYNFVVFIYGYFNEAQDGTEDTVQCPKEIGGIGNTTVISETNHSGTFYNVWDLYSTVPLFLALMMFPLLNMKSPTFFTKFNSLGTLSISYLIIFVAVKSFGWGINMDDWAIEFSIKSTFCVLSGMLTMSYFIHNIIISIMRHNEYQSNNGRDLSIAFALVTFTYVFLGAAFYMTFPLKKSCIEDNLLNNFSKRDLLALTARILLFFQLFTVFPFVTYMLRTEILSCFKMIFGKDRHGEFSYTKTILINFNIVVVCLLFACFMPKIGTLIRYTGALSGLVYIFVMPSCLKMASLGKEGTLTVPSILMHVGIMILGVINLISQFFMK